MTKYIICAAQGNVLIITEYTVNACTYTEGLALSLVFSSLSLSLSLSATFKKPHVYVVNHTSDILFC